MSRNIHVSFRNVLGATFSEALTELTDIFCEASHRYPFLADSPNLSSASKEDYVRIGRIRELPERESRQVVQNALAVLEKCLREYCGKNVVLLIDDYDVPLRQAQAWGYRTEMFPLIQKIFSRAIRDNENLQCAVVMGCLPDTLEDIFADGGNFKHYGVSASFLNDAIGFTEKECRQVFHDFGLDDYAQEFRSRNKGYLFGENRMYCPQDILDFCLHCLRKQ